MDMGAAAAGLVLALLAAGEPAPTVAVTYFDNNTSHPEFDPLAKGLADMLITDLVGLEGIRVVERTQLNRVLDELALSQTKFIDPKTALKLGQGLSARYLISGSYILADNTMRLDARVLDVKTGAVVAGESVAGQREDFFALEQQLAARLVPALLGATGAAPPRRPAPTRSFDAWMHYAGGLDAQDRGDGARAQKLFEEALSLDPDYQAAKTARERLAVVFARSGQATLSAADEALVGLDPKAADFAQKVTDLLSGLDDRNREQAARKIKVLAWLGQRHLLACPRREGPAIGEVGILANGIPMGGIVSHCQQAGDVLKIAYRLLGDRSQRETLPKVCEYFVHQLPGDKALLNYCEHVIVDGFDHAPLKEKELKKRAEWASWKALLALYANGSDQPGAPPTPR